MPLENNTGFLIHIIFLFLIYALTLRWRQQIVRLFQHLPFPTFIQYLICALPFIIVEEAVNCLECFPYTIIWLLAYILILGLIVRKMRAKNLIKILLAFAIVGTIWEVLFGGAKAIPTLPLGLALFMLLWTAFSYSFLALVPLTLLVKK